MTNTINTLIVKVKADLINQAHKTEVFREIFDAYNRYVEDETSGADYIFDINKQDDLSCCVRGGMTAKQIADVVKSDYHYFLYGHERTSPKPLAYTEVESIIRNNIDEVLQAVIAYPFVSEYRKVYTRFVTNSIIEEYFG